MRTLYIISLIISLGCNAQQRFSVDSLNNLLNNINNSSVIISLNHFETLHLDHNAMAICNRLSGSMMDKLIDNLNNKEKVLVIHAILSNSIEPFGSKLKNEYHYLADEIDYTTYTYNSFSWIQYEDGTKEIKEAEIEKIVKYWNAKKGTVLLFHKCPQ
jgi:hypothetical protein